MSSDDFLELKKLLDSDPEISSFFLRYNNINENDLLSKALEIHARAQLVHKYRCIESFRFVVPRIKYNIYYQDVLAKSKNKTILDIGCGLGQDLRKMSLDGIPQKNLFGLDIEQEFINLGYELFGDKSSNQITFITTNILDMQQFHQLKEKLSVNIIYTSAVIHLLNKDDIRSLLANINTLLSEGGIFFGQTTGLKNPGNIQDNSGRSRYLHSKDSLKNELHKVGFRNIQVTSVQRSLIETNSSNAHSVNRDMIFFYCEKEKKF